KVTWISFIFAFIAGTLITVQVGSNTELKKALAATPSFAYKLSCWDSVRGCFMRLSRAPMPPLGKALATRGGSLGEFPEPCMVRPLFSSRVPFGWLSFEVHPAGMGRIAGCPLMVLGLTLIAKF